MMAADTINTAAIDLIGRAAAGELAEFRQQVADVARQRRGVVVVSVAADGRPHIDPPIVYWDRLTVSHLQYPDLSRAVDMYDSSAECVILLVTDAMLSPMILTFGPA